MLQLCAGPGHLAVLRGAGWGLWGASGTSSSVGVPLPASTLHHVHPDCLLVPLPSSSTPAWGVGLLASSYRSWQATDVTTGTPDKCQIITRCHSWSCTASTGAHWPCASIQHHSQSPKSQGSPISLQVPPVVDRAWAVKAGLLPETCHLGLWSLY